jgi:hypothetical protein
MLKSSEHPDYFYMSENKDRTVCMVFSRVVGWYSPVQNWNKGMKAMRKARVNYEYDNKSTELSGLDI